ncbi:RsmB/NOP family class I SAM-dependent RNA methyltransferase [Roseovarius autotrophicus]|uniref:RsmB/NOP family class I SAM-dependent RNA methyltransferase n=1 Tax=Roseovarius autotrophicus TaxID=2824121 RepID=UPI001B3751B2|nr:transcription antitermination factor NusB [Roseovarius autotrophicus]
MTHPSPARVAAARLLDQVLGEGRLLSESIGTLDRLPPQDRARAQRLAIGALRGLERADRLLARHLRKAPPLPVRNVLRIAVVELAQGGEAHGVVSEAVGIVGASPRHAKLKGLINAVLRKLAEEAPRAWNDLRVPRLPEWLRDPLVAAWGKGAVAAMERAHLAGAPLDLTVRDGAEDWAARLGGEVLPTGSVRLSDPGQISALPGYAEGAWWVQDAAAALPVRVLAPKPGEVVLDMCAAPGGKTLQLAAGGARVVAVDLSERRMARVAENLARTGLAADCVVGDALAQTGDYDAVLLDAPCSATGTIRRHPDLPYAKDGAEIGALIDMQAMMLDHAISLLRPGGRVVFCTCSLLPDEGECQVEAALARHEGLVVDRDALALPGVDPAWITEEGGLRLRPDYWPEKGGMDGFYMACLRRG